MSYQIDIDLELEMGKKGLICRRYKEDPLGAIDRLFSREIILTEIKEITLSDQPIREKTSLHFRGTGWIDPEGEIVITHQGGLGDEKSYLLHLKACPSLVFVRR